MTIKVVMNSAKPLRYSPEAQAICEQVGKRVASRANAELRNMHARAKGAQFVMQSRRGRPRPYGRWRVSVTAVGQQAKEHNARFDTLIRALNS